MSDADGPTSDQVQDASASGDEQVPPLAGNRDGREDDRDPVPAPSGKPTRPWVRVVEGLVGLAILVGLFRGRQTVNLDEITLMKR